MSVGKNKRGLERRREIPEKDEEEEEEKQRGGVGVGRGGGGDGEKRGVLREGA